MHQMIAFHWIALHCIKSIAIQAAGQECQRQTPKLVQMNAAENKCMPQHGQVPTATTGVPQATRYSSFSAMSMQDSKGFCSQTLCDEEVAAYLDTTFVCWGGNIHHSDAFRVCALLLQPHLPAFGRCGNCKACTCCNELAGMLPHHHLATAWRASICHLTALIQTESDIKHVLLYHPSIVRSDIAGAATHQLAWHAIAHDETCLVHAVEQQPGHVQLPLLRAAGLFGEPDAAHSSSAGNAHACRAAGRAAACCGPAWHSAGC